ncbi:MAG: UvrD-helicase domain-containing protein, partial [Ruminococcus sp.]|nr:UvrD-helicase domain-containing protein [Ruminococcus sp.]
LINKNVELGKILPDNTITVGRGKQYSQAVLDWITEDNDFVRKLINIIEDEKGNTDLILQILKKREAERAKKSYPRMRKKEVKDELLFKLVKEMRDRYNDKLKNICKDILAILPYAESDILKHKQIIPLLIELEQDFLDILWNMKVEQNALSFDDGERMALSMLGNINDDGTVEQTSLAKEMSSYYDLIMIDEYQDSNNKQDYIFKLLSKNCIDSSGKLVYGDNVFLVGDAKQSIYQFRLANPHNFIDAVESTNHFNPNIIEPLCHIKLNQNFRSSKNIVSFVNFIFSSLMSKSCGDITYDDTEYLKFGASSYDNLDEKYQKVSISFLEKDSQVDYVVHTIQNMLDNKYPVILPDGTQRPCQPNDFCILLRKGKPCQPYIKALEAVDIHAKGEEEQGYLKSREISILLNMLRVLDNPLLDTALIAVMMSPMFMFTIEEVTEIRLIDKNKSIYGSICDIIENSDNVNKVIYYKCKMLYDKLYQLRLSSVLLSLESLIRKIYDTTDFLSVMQLYQDGEKKRVNLNLLLEYARQYEEHASITNNGGIIGFLRYIDRLVEAGKDFEQANVSCSIDSAVSVKTMHKSKGLEYPFVFLCELETSFSTQDRRKKVIFSDSGQVGIRCNIPETFETCKTLPYYVLSNKNQEDLVSSELRLMYVAMTRAKQKLFFPLYCSEKENKIISEYKSQIEPNKPIPKTIISSVKSMADWIWLCLFKKNDYEFKSLLSLDFEYDSYTEGEDKESFIVYEKWKSNKNNILNVSKKSLPPPEQSKISEIEKSMSFKYESPKTTQLSLVSVSALTKGTTAKDISLKRPKFLQETGEMIATERGTAIHTFLQYANFANAKRDLYKEAENLMMSGHLAKNQVAEIRFSDLENFFNSELYQRLCNSKVVLREKKFLIRLGDLEIDENNLTIEKELCSPDSIIKGIIDLAFLEDGGYVLVDYKTDKVRNKNILIERYKKQLYFYNLALKKITDMPIKNCYIYATYTGECIPLSF